METNIETDSQTIHREWETSDYSALKEVCHQISSGLRPCGRGGGKSERAKGETRPYKHSRTNADHFWYLKWSFQYSYIGPAAVCTSWHPRSKRSGPMSPSLTQKPSLIDNKHANENLVSPWRVSWRNRLLLRVGHMHNHRCSTKNELNGIFGSSSELFKNFIFMFFSFTLQVLCIYNMDSGCVLLWNSWVWEIVGLGICIYFLCFVSGFFPFVCFVLLWFICFVLSYLIFYYYCLEACLFSKGCGYR